MCWTSHRRHSWASIAAVAFVYSVCWGCGGDSAPQEGDGADAGVGPGGNVIASSEFARVSGVGAYELAENQDGFVVSLYDLDETLLGTATLTTEVGGDWLASFEPTDESEAAATLRMSYWSPEPDASALLTYTLTVQDEEATGGEIMLRILITGSTDIFGSDSIPDDWIERIVLEAPLPSGGVPLGTGGLRHGDDTTWAMLVTVGDGASAASDEELGSWFAAVGLGALARTHSHDYLLALTHDFSLALELAERLRDDLGDESASQGGTSGPKLHMSNDCSDGLVQMRADAELCEQGSRCAQHRVTECARYVEVNGISHCSGSRSYIRYTNFLDDEVCAFELLACVRASNILPRCETAQMASVDDTDCRQRYPFCTAGQNAFAAADGHRCECLVTQESCATYCDGLEASLGLAPGIFSAAYNAFVCDCGFDPADYCASQWSDIDCGGGDYQAATGSFSCNTAACNDLRPTATCVDNPALVEACDASSPVGNTCSEGFECVDCECVDCEISVMCGDGRVSTTCPGLEEECDGTGQAQCGDGFECQDCGCVASTTGGNGDDEECDETGDCPDGNECVGGLCADIGLPEDCPPTFRTRTTGDWPAAPFCDNSVDELTLRCCYQAPPELGLNWERVRFSAQFRVTEFEEPCFDCAAFYRANEHITSRQDVLTSDSHYVWLDSQWETTGVGSVEEGDGMPDEARLAYEEALFRALEEISYECVFPCTCPSLCN